MGAWIEIGSATKRPIKIASPLLWGRGLKLNVNVTLCLSLLVAPFVGAWIEIIFALGTYDVSSSRPFCGGVD